MEIIKMKERSDLRVRSPVLSLASDRSLA